MFGNELFDKWLMRIIGAMAFAFLVWYWASTLWKAAYGIGYRYGAESDTRAVDMLEVPYTDGWEMDADGRWQKPGVSDIP